MLDLVCFVVIQILILMLLMYISWMGLMLVGKYED